MIEVSSAYPFGGPKLHDGKKPTRACSFVGRHNRFSSIKLLNHTAKTKGYSGSGAVTGDLWGNDGGKYIRVVAKIGAVTGDLWGNDGIDLLRALHGCGAVTGDLWGNDGI
jgi:hypothetical protein